LLDAYASSWPFELEPWPSKSLRTASLDSPVALARKLPNVIAGAGATEAVARAAGAFLLDGDPVTAAERVADEGR
jgi:hypothetical protein